MTNYPAWKKRDFREKWRNFLAVFITIVLFFAILNGLVKTFSLKKYLGQIKWDGRSSFVAGLGTWPPSVLVYRKDSPKIAILKLSRDSYFATGKTSEPLVRLGDVVNNKLSDDFTRILSIAFGTRVENYIFFEDQIFVTEESIQNLFKNFSSIRTPFEILGQGLDGNIEETNITRIDQIRLWWQLKGLSIEKLEINDLSGLAEEIVFANDQKVLGADEASLHLRITKYLENSKFLEKNYKVGIHNASGFPAAGELAAEFATSVGLNVVKVETTSGSEDKTRIVTDNREDFAAGYLANIFNCDIVGSPFGVSGESIEAGSDEIVVIIGRDFASEYFR